MQYQLESSASLLIIEPWRTSTDGCRLELKLKLRGTTHLIYFQANQPLSSRAEAALAIALIPAMKHGINIQAVGDVSPLIMDALPKIQSAFKAMKPRLSLVSISGISSHTPSPPKEFRAGVFFAAGVDSYYVLIKNQNEITDLIFVRGFNIPLGEDELLKRVSRSVHRAADVFGKNVVEIETNLRPFLESHFPWLFGFGPALASVGHLLADEFSRLFIASAHDDQYLMRAGSTPEIDPLWSTEFLTFTHEGLEASRLQRIKLLSQYPIVLDTLQVCNNNPGGEYNCGRCEKCIRTMIELRIAGALDNCNVFTSPLSTKRVSNLNLINRDARQYAEENLKALEELNLDPELQNALKIAINKPQWLLNTRKWFQKQLQRLAPRTRFSK